MKYIAVIVILITTSTLFAAPIENVTSSALMVGDSALFNLDFIDPFGIPLYDVILKAKAGSSEYVNTLSHIEGDPRYATTFEGTIDFDNPSGTMEYYGRIEADTLIATQSYKNAANQFPPAASLYAALTGDAIGDTTPGSAGQWLDLTGSAVTYSETRLYGRLNNAGGGWPLNEGLTTYFIYGFVIYNPDTLTLSALAMLYVNVPFIMTSGLYRVDLADTSFSRIAAISTQTSGTSLHMACDISDITSDPLFPAWPPESGYIVAGGITITAEVGQPGFNDYTYPSLFIPATQFLAVDINSAPTLTDIGFDVIPNVTVNARINYFDFDGNLPVQRLIFFDWGVFDMGSFDHSYGDTADFFHLMTWPGEGMHYYYFRFSDGRDTIETPFDSLYLAPSAAHDERLPIAFELAQNYPNPFNSRTAISFTLSAPAEVELSVYDIAGCQVARLLQGNSNAGSHTAMWDSRDFSGQNVSSGVYFYRLRIDGSAGEARKMLLLK
ncbi:MAG: hypothetical protein A2W25_02100 [candidate division Zixibacteria bacterium RBG_16_53_22]|nr:MAG: hypothetical protein A2W25_02100 [candidate division Zixibacteria bacterium RBG_16_53_22]